MVLEQNFQPQGCDTSHGAVDHTYIPRADGSIMVNGIAYIPQTQAPVVLPVVGAVEAAVNVPITVKPGEEAQVVTGVPATVLQPHVQVAYGSFVLSSTCLCSQLQHLSGGEKLQVRHFIFAIFNHSRRSNQ